ncbi:TIGR03086 family metal-binding protein [Amycolatopsis jejuensis]|uniref:TIGR03086 family metal-binding protein n=1 Tax=Amycolatopsis jejuensis TaxID=330084 RepID=UPI000524E7F6|nr:TIGR03086 family metal-binding protein [Amycolatopsis jejuensis]
MTTFDLDRQSLLVLDRIVAGTTAADLDRPTPCAGWTLRDLLRHQVSENHAFAEAARKGSARDWEGGQLGDDAYSAYAASVDDYLAAFGEAGVAERSIAINTFGTFSGEVATAMHLVDTVAHGWDLARTFDVAYEPVPEAVHVALKFAMGIPADPAERVARGTFAPVVPVADDASEIDRFLGLLGRDPRVS